MRNTPPSPCPLQGGWTPLPKNNQFSRLLFLMHHILLAAPFTLPPHLLVWIQTSARQQQGPGVTQPIGNCPAASTSELSLFCLASLWWTDMFLKLRIRMAREILLLLLLILLLLLLSFKILGSVTPRTTPSTSIIFYNPITQFMLHVLKWKWITAQWLPLLLLFGEDKIYKSQALLYLRSYIFESYFPLIHSPPTPLPKLTAV